MRKSSLLLLPILMFATGCGKKPSGYDRVHLTNLGECCKLVEASSTSKGQYIKCSTKVFDKEVDIEGIFSQGTYILLKEGAYCPVCLTTIC